MPLQRFADSGHEGSGHNFRNAESLAMSLRHRSGHPVIAIMPTMERRAELRLLAELSVDIGGMDANGLPYRQTVSARNISLGGALLTGVRQRLRCGDLMTLQRDGLLARFRVVWIRDSQVAVQKLKNEPCLWQELLEPGSQVAAGGSPQPSLP